MFWPGRLSVMGFSKPVKSLFMDTERSHEVPVEYGLLSASSAGSGIEISDIALARWPLFHNAQPITLVSHSFSTAFGVGYIQLTRSLTDNFSEEVCL
jgi:hypothetical protein